MPSWSQASSSWEEMGSRSSSSPGNAGSTWATSVTRAWVPWVSWEIACRVAGSGEGSAFSREGSTTSTSVVASRSPSFSIQAR